MWSLNQMHCWCLSKRALCFYQYSINNRDKDLFAELTPYCPVSRLVMAQRLKSVNLALFLSVLMRPVTPETQIILNQWGKYQFILNNDLKKAWIVLLTTNFLIQIISKSGKDVSHYFVINFKAIQLFQNCSKTTRKDMQLQELEM